jgi:membrane protease YdiL (CAAX protease family)
MFGVDAFVARQAYGAFALKVRLPSPVCPNASCFPSVAILPEISFNARFGSVLAAARDFDPIDGAGSSYRNDMKAFLRRHTLVAFFVLAFVLSWYPWIVALIRGRTSGPNPLGPLVAAIIVTAIVSGRSGLREFFSRLVRWRVGIKWYAITLVTPVIFCLIAVAITLCFASRSQISGLSTEKMRELPDRFLFILLFIGLGEEPGWRGFALPQLQTKYSPLIASLILAPLWALWHLPLIGTEFPLSIVAPFVLSVFGATFMLTWIFNGTKGSVLLPMLMHATVNTVGAGLMFPLFSGTALIVLWWIYGFIWLCAGLGALLFNANKSDRVLPS